MTYLLRTCSSDMTSYGGFAWPRSGPVGCPDWDPTPECGHGLHGLLDGEGDGSLLHWAPDAVWLVVEVTEYVDLAGKAKAPRGTVVHCGDQLSSTAWLPSRAPVTVAAGCDEEPATY